VGQFRPICVTLVTSVTAPIASSIADITALDLRLTRTNSGRVVSWQPTNWERKLIDWAGVRGYRLIIMTFCNARQASLYIRSTRHCP
jgi:hypothetical protein